MMSRHCFFKVMKEDFRHKIWMLVLSILGNILAIPVVYLMSTQTTVYYGDVPVYRLLRQAGDVVDFFSGILCVTGGIVAIAGALIVGLAGFRYVFHRSMTDTWHSMPVKRRTLFAAGWLNGLLIWLVPFLANLTVTMLLGIGKLNGLRRAFETASGKTDEMAESFALLTGGLIFKNGLATALALLVAFLLVYNLVLAAVMLCGNVLNTLVVTGVAGAGAISVYGLWLAFCSYYLDTFISGIAKGYRIIVYASPLASTVNLLYRRSEGGGSESFWTALLINLAIALCLGALAALVYSRRPSELAEQGIKMKPVCFVLQAVTAIAAGMGGWLLFSVITADFIGSAGATAWGVFGGLLASILVSGVMDIVFHMDFKAFFAHKLLMAGTAAAVLLLGFGFRGDWLGYDGYLPDKEEIAEIAVQTQRTAAMGVQLQEMHYTDADVIYDFLKTATDYEKYGHTQEADVMARDVVQTKVTLKSGRSYYRSYQVFNYDCDAALKLLTSDAYQELYWRIPEEAVGELFNINVESGAGTGETGMIGQEALREICVAFNRDMEEQPALGIQGGTRCFCTVSLLTEEYDTKYRFTVWEEMTHTIEALKKNGYGGFVEPVDAEEVEKIRLSLDWWYSELEEDADLVQLAREYYQVYDGTAGLAADEPEKTSESADMPTAPVRTSGGTDSGKDGRVTLTITDREEIAELLELFSYYQYYSNGAFQMRDTRGGIEIVTGDTAESAYIFEGALPEKYILKFGELER